jgi:xylulokinase
MSLLGLDVGTTGAKAIVFREDGALLGQGYREYPLLHPRPDWIELDPTQVWELTAEAIREAVANAGGADPVEALAVSCLGEATAPVARDGRIVRNSILGFDARGQEEVDWWEAEVGRDRVFRITGRPLSIMYTAHKLMWLKKHEPQVYDGTWKFLGYGDYTLWRLGAEPAIDYSLAGTMMLFDVNTKQWSQELLELAGLDAGKLSKPVPAGTEVGTLSPAVAESLGLPPGVKLVTGGHDQPCGALGSGCVEDGMAMDATGTVECLTPAFSRLVLTDGMLRSNLCCYDHTVPGMYVSLAFNFTGGSLLKWFRDTLGQADVEEARRTGDDVYDVLLRQCADEPSPVLVLPHLTLTGTPWMDPKAKGALFGLQLSTTKGELIKGLLDGITYEMRLNLELLREAGVTIRELRAIGGGAKSPFWLQLKADIFGMPVARLNVTECACLGAALLAGTAAGRYNSVAEAAQSVVSVEQVYEPRPEKEAAYRDKYAIYRDLYPTTAPLSHRL